MREESWRRYVATDGMFELWLPPDAELSEDETAPPGETYLYWSPQPNLGTFSVFCQPAPGDSPEDLLALERDLSTEITVEVNERVSRESGPVHRLRYRTAETAPRETVRDPVTGSISHLPARRVVQIAEYLFWHGKSSTVSAGYRVDADAPTDLIATFARMLERFRLLEAP